MFRIILLLFLSVFCLPACNQYRHMEKIQGGGDCVVKFKPDLHATVYKASVDVVGRHLSGLLIFKQTSDTITHVVFSNEFGFKFFDFEFLNNGVFRVASITPGMDKKAVIKTLKKDFELIMFRNISSSTQKDSIVSFSLRSDSLIYHGYAQQQGINYYITDTACSRLVKMQRASKRKPVAEAFMYMDETGNVPDSISIRHLNFSFSISLKKISALELH